MVYKYGVCISKEMRWSEVVDRFMRSEWVLRNGMRELYIGDRGLYTALPGVPKYWHRALVPHVQRAVVTCEYGLDWWSEEQRFREKDDVVHRVKFTMDNTFYHHVQANWALMSNHPR